MKEFHVTTLLSSIKAHVVTELHILTHPTPEMSLLRSEEKDSVNKIITDLYL